MRCLTLLNVENNNKYCFSWSTLAYRHFCEDSQHKRVSTYMKYLKDLKNKGFDFSPGFQISDNHRFEKFNKLSLNVIELKSNQNEKEGKFKKNLLESVKMLQIKLLT